MQAPDVYRALAPPVPLTTRVVTPADVTIVIPTYDRDDILLQTIEHDLTLDPPAGAILVIDQTPRHSPEVERKLDLYNKSGQIRWLDQGRPSQPAAMNAGLRYAQTDYVLFQDDDVIPCAKLIASFVEALNDLRVRVPECRFVVGQVLQPNESVTRRKGGTFSTPWSGAERCFTDDASAGNFCVHRSTALKLEGFDENYVGAAYRAESDFARRVIQHGYAILFEPQASIRHLRASKGGTRSYGNHRTTWKPHHAVGSYYYLLCWRSLPPGDSIAALLRHSFLNRHHLRRPWFIPATVTAHILAFGWALYLRGRGRRLIHNYGSGGCLFSNSGDRK